MQGDIKYSYTVGRMADTQTITAAELMHWVASVPLGIILVIFGLIGNCLSLVVWNNIRRSIGETSSTVRYFMTMSVIDSLLLIFFVFTDSIKSAAPSLTQSYWYILLFSYLLFPFFFYLIVSSIWIVVAVTIDRYMLIVRKYQIPDTTTLFSLVIMFLSIFFINLPHFFNYYPLYNSTMNSWSLAQTEYAKSESGARYEFWVHCIFLVITPWFFIAPMNISILRMILVSNKKAMKLMGRNPSSSSPPSQMTALSTSSSNINTDGYSNYEETAKKLDAGKKARKKQSRKTTITLLTVTFTFFGLMIWQCIAQCFWMQEFHKHDVDKEIWTKVDISFAFAKLGIVINSSVNCLLYFFTGTVFRTELKNVIKKIFRRE